MKLLLAALSIMVIAGCTNASNSPVAPVVCGVETTAEQGMAAAIKAATGCPNVDAIQASIAAEATSLKINFCPDPAAKKSIIGDVVCAPLINGVKSSLLAKFPASWGACTGGQLTDAGIAQILAACQKAL